MSKIATIISREYVTRVRKKSFIIMSIIGPILFASLMIGPAYLAQLEDTEEKLIAVADSSHLFIGEFPETEYIKFEYLSSADIQKTKDLFYESPYYAILYINKNVVNQNIGKNSKAYVSLFSDKSPSLGVQMHISNAIEKKLERDKLTTYGIDENILKAVKSEVTVKSIKLSRSGEEKESNFPLNMALGYIAGFLIYFTIFFSGSQVMRGVIEEKTNRIVEVIISSVKPFQLMMGKIIGVGLVSLTQFALWGVLTMGLYLIAAPLIMPNVAEMQQAMQVQEFGEAGSTLNAQSPVNDEMVSKASEIFDTVSAIDFGVVIGTFIFFFIGGYFLYASMFAAIGSAVDNETDTQQFMLPITLPMIFAIVAMVNIIQNPESPLAFWFSIIPFTSPVVMMARIPFGVPDWHVFLAGALLVITFVVFTWLSAKIYRTGILMYGKRTSWKEIWKWLKHS